MIADFDIRKSLTLPLQVWSLAKDVWRSSSGVYGALAFLNQWVPVIVV